jgi:hypothetical protein
MMDGGLARLKQGISIVVFPQTTRMVDFDASQFNSIGVKLAKKAGVPVVPARTEDACVVQWSPAQGFRENPPGAQGAFCVWCAAADRRQWIGATGAGGATRSASTWHYGKMGRNA